MSTVQGRRKSSAHTGGSSPRNQTTGRQAPPRALKGRSKSGDIVLELGARVNALRREAGLTLNELAARSGVSRAMLSKVERGEKSPTLSIVSRTAVGLNVSLSALLGAEPDSAEVAVVRRKHRLVYRDPETGFGRELLSPTHIDNGVELLLHTIPPRSSSGELPAYTNPTEKYLIVNEGRLVFRMGGVRQILDTGDSLYFEVKRSYRFDNDFDEPVTYTLVVVRRR